MRFLRKIRPSIHSLIALILLLPIVALSVALLVLSNRTSDRVQDDLGGALVRTAGNALTESIGTSLLEAERTLELYIHRIDSGTLPVETGPAWERLMYESLRVRPALASIVYVNANGHASWVVREGNTYLAGDSDPNRPNGTAEYVLKLNGDREEVPQRVYDYDARQRDWYARGLAARSATWTDAFFWKQTGPRVRERHRVAGMGCVQGIFRGDEQVGVLMVDVPLRSISSQLRTSETARLGSMFIVDAHDNLLADSLRLAESAERRMVPLSEFDNPIAKAAVAAMHATSVAKDRDESSGPLTYVQTISPRPGVEWKLAMVLPGDNVITEARTMQRDGLIISGLIVTGVLALTVVLSRQLSRRLVGLAAHLRQIGRGHFDRTLNMSLTAELEELSDAVNDMTRQLKDQVQLRAAKEAAEQINESRSAFFARVTHELRTPLNAIIGYAEILEESPVVQRDKNAKNDIRCVLQASRQLLRLINDLLDLAKLESGRMTVRWKEADIASVVDETEDTVRPLIEKNNNVFEVHLPEGIGSAQTDPGVLRQVLLNLLSNAGKFTRDGRVTLAVRRDQAHLHFSVKDTGIGMPPETIETMFDPFMQAAGAPAGTGLGLSISRQLTHLLGGELELSSEPEKGTTADIYFPASPRTRADGG